MLNPQRRSTKRAPQQGASGNHDVSDSGATVTVTGQDGARNGMHNTATSSPSARRDAFMQEDNPPHDDDVMEYVPGTNLY